MDIKDDAFIIPKYIWDDDYHNLEQKIVWSFIDTHCNEVFTLKELMAKTHLSRGRLLNAIKVLIDCDIVHKKKIITEKNTVGTVYMHYTGDEEFLKDINWATTKKVSL